MIERALKRTLVSDLQFYPAVAILGARQVGKTTLARELTSVLRRDGLESEFFDLELDSDVARLRNAEAVLLELQTKTVVIDEVQRQPELFSLVRALIDKHRVPARFVLLGSSSTELLQRSSESLAGRCSYHQLTPFGIHEMTPNLEHSAEPSGPKVPSEFDVTKQLLVRGGFPVSYLAPTDSFSLSWRKSLLNTYAERDLQLAGIGAKPQVVKQFLAMLAHHHSGVWNAQTFANSLGVSSVTVAKYFRFLEQSFLVESLQPYHLNLGKRIVRSRKVYFADSGLVGSYFNSTVYADLLNLPHAGAIWEGFVYQTIRSILKPDDEVWFYRTHAGAEVDFVITRNQRVEYCVEAKLSNAPSLTKSFSHAIQDLSPQKTLVVTPNSKRYPIKNDIEALSLAEFVRWYLDGESRS